MKQVSVHSRIKEERSKEEARWDSLLSFKGVAKKKSLVTIADKPPVGPDAKRTAKLKNRGAYISKLPQFGNVNFSDDADTTSDDTINVIGEVTYPNLKSAMEGVVSACITLGGGAVENLNHGYIVRFLFNYMLDEAQGLFHACQLKLAPAVFWDMLHAMTARRSANWSFLIKDFERPDWIACDTAHDGRPFGIVGPVDYGFSIVDLTMTSYTNAKGYEETMKLFTECGDKANCKGCEYREISPDDHSMYTWTAQKVGAFDFIGWTCEGNISVMENDIMSLLPIPCKWLGALGILNSRACASGNHHSRMSCSPGGLVAHRILKKYTGYTNHAEVVVIKPIPLWELMMVCFKLQQQGLLVGWPSSSDTNNAWRAADLRFGSWKKITYTAMVRHFARNAAVACNAVQNSTPLYFAATGNGPVHGSGGIMLPQAIEKNLACMYEYQIGNVWFYPMLWHDQDMTYEDIDYWMEGPSVNADDWNWVTNFGENSNDELAPCYSPLDLAMPLYAKCAGWIQGYMPWAPMVYVDNFNAGQCSALYASVETNPLVSVLSPRLVNPEVRKHLDSMILPAYILYWPTLVYNVDGNDAKSGVQHLLGERFSISGDKGELRQWTTVFNSLSSGVYKTGGSGTDLGTVDREKYTTFLDTLKKRGQIAQVEEDFELLT